MKIYLLTILTIVSTTLMAQFSLEWNFTYDWDMNYFEYSPIKYSPPENIDQITFNYTSKKDVRTYTKTFQNGKLTSYSFKNKQNNVVKEAKLTYDEKSELAEFQRFKKGSLKSKTLYVRNEKGEPLSQKRFNSKDAITDYNTWAYNEDGCLTEVVYYKKGGEKIMSRWVNEYREGCERSKSYAYNGKGKLRNEWTYDCKSEGEKLEKKKNTTQVCKWEEMGPDVITKVFETFDEKGKTMKDITKYTANDTLILEWTRYNHKNEMIYKTTYDKDLHKALTYQNFKKGKVVYASVYEYKNDQIVTATRSKKGKQIGKSSYIYNQDNLLTNYTYYGKKDVVYKEIELVY